MAEDLVVLIKKNHVANPGQFAKAHCSPSLTQGSLYGWKGVPFKISNVSENKV